MKNYTPMHPQYREARKNENRARRNASALIWLLSFLLAAAICLCAWGLSNIHQ